ncbi:AAA family ATPase [bacterium]|nr:AAA family ATPase [bacterium]
MTASPPKIFGHQQTIRALTEAVNENRLHHTLLFTGREGIGKKLIAELLAKTFFCQNQGATWSFGGCDHCHHCTLVRSRHMPDLLSFSCADKEKTSTEGVREILNSLRLKPFSGKYRFLIFDEAHLLQGQAANVLLKSLEEPREGTSFILVTGKPHLMLRTIHSRAQRWGFHRLSATELRKVIEQDTLSEEATSARESLSSEQEAKLFGFANGSSEAYFLLLHQGEALFQREKSLLAIARGDRAAALELGSELSQSKETLSSELSTLRLIARYHLIHEAEPKWATFLEEMGEMEHYLLKRNFAPLYILQQLFLHLADPFPERFVVERESGLDALIV